MPSTMNLLSVFPASFIEEKNLTEDELNNAKRDFRQIFNKPDNYELDITNPQYGDLIKFIAIAKRFDRCRRSIRYLITEFQRIFQGVYKPAYNLIFVAIWMRDAPLSRDTVSNLKFDKRNYLDLKKNEKTICNNLGVMIKEISCLTEIFKSPIEMGDFPSIQDLYNYLEKFNEVFKKLFNFQVADINRGGILEPYKLLRNAIAHSHFIFVDNQIRLVDWQYRPRKVKDILKYNLKEIREEITIISMIFCQIIALYQLIQQYKTKKPSKKT